MFFDTKKKIEFLRHRRWYLNQLGQMVHPNCEKMLSRRDLRRMSWEQLHKLVAELHTEEKAVTI